MTVMSVENAAGMTETGSSRAMSFILVNSFARRLLKRNGGRLTNPKELSVSLQPVSLATSRKRFLVIEDEPDIANLLALHLGDLDADVVIEHDGPQGLNQALTGQWDAILLDLRLPNLDGLDICRTIRAQASFVPIMMLTSRDTELDRVLGLEIGADDYMVKPFSVAELKARVKALIRRARQQNSPVTTNSEQLVAQDLILNHAKRSVVLEKKSIELTAKEFDLLWFFASSPGTVFKRGELLDKVWGYGHEGYEHTVNSHINRLRSKLEKDPGNPRYIQTIWGVGYRFLEQAETA